MSIRQTCFANSNLQGRHQEKSRLRLFSAKSLRGGSRPLGSAPARRGNSLPGAERANEGIRVFVSQKVGGLVQFKQRVVEIVARELVACLLENLLEAIARVLQVPLQRSGA